MSAVADLQVSFDPEGFMTDPNEWSEEIAVVLGEGRGYRRTDRPPLGRHQFVRDEFDSTGKPPTLRTITKKSGVPTKEVYELFPKGPAKKVSRVSPASASRRAASRSDRSGSPLSAGEHDADVATELTN